MICIPMFLPTVYEYTESDPPRQTDLKMGDGATYPAVLLNTISGRQSNNLLICRAAPLP